MAVYISAPGKSSGKNLITDRCRCMSNTQQYVCEWTHGPVNSIIRVATVGNKRRFSTEVGVKAFV
jgi:hypothetical protein